MLLGVFVIGLIGLLLLGAAAALVYVNRDKLEIPFLENLVTEDENSGTGNQDSEGGGMSPSTASPPAVSRPIAATSPMHVDGASYSKVSHRSDVLVLVDFYANWCGPCKKLSPSLEKLAKEHGDKVIVLKVNVDTEQQLAKQAGVRSIPDVRILYDGSEVDRFVGLIPYQNIEQLILKHEALLPAPRAAHGVEQAGGEGSVDPVSGRYLPPGISRKK